MNPVDQTEFDIGSGNCFSACIATLLDLPIEEVPNLNTLELDADGSHWFDRWRKWLYHRGLGLIYVTYSGEWPDISLPSGMRGILSGRSPRWSEGNPDLYHAVVVEVVARQEKQMFCWDIEMKHDPHPSRDGVTEPRSLMILVQVAS